MADNKEDLEEQLKQLAIKVCELNGIDPFAKIEIEQWQWVGNEVIQFLGAEPLNETPQKLDS